ncbi:MAG: SH3 domain-containing protein [Planctomycetes bacterium]|nr:SH3 domain-containing protein [Planctomycetota bacterium]
MKAKHWSALVLAAALLGTALRATPQETLAAGSQGRIGLETATLREAARMFSPSVATLREGDLVTILAPEGGWYRVRAGAVEGYLHSSCLYKKADYDLGAAGAGAGEVTDAERTAAARGFNPEVEAQHREEQPQLEQGYRLVDRIEAISIPVEEVARFVREGGIEP